MDKNGLYGFMLGTNISNYTGGTSHRWSASF